MKLDSLRTLWIEEMKDLYNAENQLLKALPKMAKRATTPELKKAFESHLEETQGHVERLDEIFVKLAAETAAAHPIYDAYFTHFNDAYNKGTAL